ncbi:Putative competence-damage inducible protein [Commensalibacter sp. Nvir]|uniref:competence/damage-inducible protein A n=1 Tax=Commensalibacter sp. Nvir TaxID=3069817 RepID=UPI002D27BB1F|nr:Putative competence-damage inducible protein [Commensalibacter sp. Nvir]
MSPTAIIIVIGNEILSGRTQDTNVNYIAKKLASVGIKLKEVRIIPDDRKVIVHALKTLRSTVDYVFTTGGIGPTHDDITSDCVAEAFGVSNPIHEESFKKLENYVGAKNFNKARQRMAHLPLGAVPIPNPISVAPGYIMGNVYVMAGVPQIMRTMFDAILPTLRHGDPIISRTWYAFDALEGAIAEGLSTLQQTYPQIEIGSYPFYDLNGKDGVALVAKGQDQTSVKEAAKKIRSLLISIGYDPHEGEPKP